MSGPTKEFPSAVEAEAFALEHPGARVVKPPTRRGNGGPWKVILPDPAVHAIDQLTHALTSGRPVAAPADIAVRALRADLMSYDFPELRYSWAPYYPLRATSMLNSEGGAGKSIFSLAQSLHGAAGKPYLGSATREGVYVYLSCEDDTDIIERRAQKILATFTEEERAKAIANFRLIDGVGKGLRFVASADGIAGIDPTVDRIIEAVKAAAAGRPIVQAVGDTVSRLNGGQENATEVMSAVEQAGARIAQSLDCAWIWLHHVSKAVAREGIADAHAGRGASSFGDNCRSVLRLMPLTWQMVSKAKFEGLDRIEVERGDILVLRHAKLNQDRRADPVYLRRTAQGLLERITPTVRSDAVSVDENMRSLVEWFTGERKSEPFSLSAARDAWLKWTRMPRRAANEFLEDAIRDKLLLEGGSLKGRTLYVPAPDALTRGRVFSDPNGWIEE